MAVTRKSRSIVLDTQGDKTTDILILESLQFQITGGVAGDYWEVTDSNGDIQGRGYVVSPVQNVEILVECRTVRGLEFTRRPTNGQSQIFGRLK